MLTELQKHLQYFNDDTELSFDEPTHVYTNKDKQVYKSATQFLGDFEDKFDQEYWGMYTALKNAGRKVKPDDTKKVIYVDGRPAKLKDLHKDSIYKHLYTATVASWKAKNAESIHRGNSIHNHLEDSINQSKGFFNGESDNAHITYKDKRLRTISTQNDLDATDLKEKYPFIYGRLQKFIERDCIIYAEKKVKLDLAQLAGTIDVPIIKRDTNRFCILDWKTNKDEFKPSSGYMKKIFVGGEWVKSDIFVPTDDRFKYPINHLSLCKLNVYFLQLSLYAYMLECWGYELVNNGLEIIHIRPGVDPKLIKVPYLKDEIEVLIRYRLSELGIPFFDNNTKIGYDYGH